MKRLLVYWMSLWGLLCSQRTEACTSLIVSGNVTSDGKPVMFKHRDTDCLDNRVEYFQGEKWAFIGLTNRVPTRPFGWAEYTGAEVWSGVNEVGFCIMNTADYNLQNDAVSKDSMDCEGLLMYEALGTCRTVEDFRDFLTSHPKPLRVEANFGVIDAQGGASYFEVNNYRFWEYDVNASETGYRVQTNFAFAGRQQDRAGVERYQTASAIMEEYAAFHAQGEYKLHHNELMELLSRSYRHEVLGLDADYCPDKGVAVDQDFIPRRSTSAVIVFEGVCKGEDPKHTLMWTALGYPATAVMIPLLVAPQMLPASILPDARGHSAWCDYSLHLKNKYIFPDSGSSSRRYVHLDVVQRGTEGRPSLKQCARQAQVQIDTMFEPLYQQWLRSNNDAAFYSHYSQQWKRWEDAYHRAFAPWMH